MQAEASGPDIRTLVETVNIAENLDEETLAEIATQCVEGYLQDVESRRDWEDELEEWTKLASQVREEKSFPWRNASNIKYPILSTAAMQFAARAYPTLIPSNGDIVKIAVIGEDKDGAKELRANRVGTYMSYQMLREIEDWEESMDQLLLTLPIVGTMFRKTYFDFIERKVRSELIHPRDLVVDYYAKNLKTAERISHKLPLTKRVVDGLIRSGVYLKDVELGDPVQEGKQGTPPTDETTPYDIIEQQTYYDINNDGVLLPVVVTFELHSRKILRIAAAFEEDDQIMVDGEVARVNAIQYYTKFTFVPHPDGRFYGIGFGALLGPLNEAINSVINQLVDAGTLANLQAGFLGKGLRLRAGDTGFKPGEWKVAQAPGDDLRKQIVPLPSKEPSNVLFELMNALVGSAKELASVAEIFVGKMPGQNTPATTTMASIEQGMKVFTAVYKRIYRALAEEFKKIFRLNGHYLDPYKYSKVLDMEINPGDFNEDDYDVIPAADPNAASEQQRLQKAQALLELLNTGLLDPIEVVRRVLVAQDQPNIDKLFSPQVRETGAPPPPQPDPKLLAMQAKSQNDQQMMVMKKTELEHKMAMEQRSKEADIALKAMEAHQDMKITMAKAQIEGQAKLHNQQIFSAAETMKTRQQLAQKDAVHQQDMKHSEESAKLAAKQQQSKPSATGKPKK